MQRDEERHAMELDFAGCAAGIEGLGPGKRVVMWVRGCALACPGCMTPELWARSPARFSHSVEEIAALLRPLLEGSDGLTISGGEPMEQAAALKNLVQLLRLDGSDLEVLVYSGHSLEHLLQQGQESLEFLNEIDILIDNPFIRSTSNLVKWRGSDNQRVHYLSPKSQKHLESHQDDRADEERPLQIQMLGNGQFRIIGIPKRGDLTRYRQMMEQVGIQVGKFKG